LGVKIYPLLTFLPSLEILGLFLVGLYAVVKKRNLARMIIGIVVMELSADLFLSVVGERSGIITLAGVGAVVLLAMLVSMLHEKAGTLDITKIKELKG
jgi:multisubunit Na+/H+ antiporter MnhC subunit